MRFAPYVILMLCISAIFYLMGLTQPLVSVYDTHSGQFLKLNCPADADPPSPYQNEDPECTDTFFSILMGVLTIGILGVVVSTLMGFSAMYIVPIILLYILVNFFVFPFSILLDTAAMPPEISVLLVVAINAISVLALLNFIRGGT